MNFYSLSFIFFYLPVAVLLYRICPEKFKNVAISVISIIFYALCQPQYFIHFVIVLIAEFGISNLLYRTMEKEKQNKLIFVSAIALNAAVMLIYSMFNQVEGTEIPLGTMVVCFTSIGYFTDVYKRECEYIKNPFDFMVFIAFFGKLYRGPLERYEEYRLSKYDRKDIFARSGNGIYLFVKGCAKYTLLARPLTDLYNQVAKSNAKEMSVLGAWLSIISVSMVIFYGLSSFCDMARGIGYLFDMKLSKNFYFPFQSLSVTDFLYRFNITVTGFFRHYVYDNLRTKKDSSLQFCVDTYLICVLCGIWFGIRLTYVIWGIYIATFVIIERFFLLKILNSIPKLFARVYTFCVTMLSMTLFSVSSSGLVDTLKGMFGVGDVSASTGEISYILSQNILVLVVGAFFLTSIFSLFINYLKDNHKSMYGAVVTLETVALIILIAAFSI